MSDKRPWATVARCARAFVHGCSDGRAARRGDALTGRHQDGDADPGSDERERDGDAREKARAFFAVLEDGF